MYKHYTILGSIASKAQGERILQYQYNTEEELVSVTNEKKEVWEWKRDIKGYVMEEKRYDGQVYTYERDYRGQVTKINRPDHRYTNYMYDKMGQFVLSIMIIAMKIFVMIKMA